MRDTMRLIDLTLMDIAALKIYTYYAPPFDYAHIKTNLSEISTA